MEITGKTALVTGAGRGPARGSSAVLNILSVLSWLSIPRSGAYCAAKSAEWSLTNALRLELAQQGTRVTALHVGYLDTDHPRSLAGGPRGPRHLSSGRPEVE